MKEFLSLGSVFLLLQKVRLTIMTQTALHHHLHDITVNHYCIDHHYCYYMSVLFEVLVTLFAHFKNYQFDGLEF